MFKSILLSFSLLFTLQAWTSDLQPDRNESKYIAIENFDEYQGIGLVSNRDGQAYDPVSAFPEGGGQVVIGNANITASHGAITYHFANEANKELFLSNPLKYEPTYGGWCAWAAAQSGYAPVHPPFVTLHGNRAHYFISRGAKARFDNELLFHEANADDFWKSESGEDPRI